MLDGRPLRLPGGAMLRLRPRALAEAVAAEWSEAGGGVPGGRFGPERLGLTRLAGTLQERVAPQREQAIGRLLANIDSDLLCYRATHPASLVARQRESWQPWLDWCRDTHGAELVVAAGVMPVVQPEPVRAALGAVLAAQDNAVLTGLGVLVPLLGSLVLGLAVGCDALAPDLAVDLALLDEVHQGARWGIDAEVARRRVRAVEEAREVSRFIVLTRPEAAQCWLIDGRVQGVGYRRWLQDEARMQGLTGWVRNLSDGRVEAVVQGPPASLEALRQAAVQGPAHAAVDRLRVEDWHEPVPLGRFTQIADA